MAHVFLVDWLHRFHSWQTKSQRGKGMEEENCLPHGGHKVKWSSREPNQVTTLKTHLYCLTSSNQGPSFRVPPGPKKLLAFWF